MVNLDKETKAEIQDALFARPDEKEWRIDRAAHALGLLPDWIPMRPLSVTGEVNLANRTQQVLDGSSAIASRAFSSGP